MTMRPLVAAGARLVLGKAADASRMRVAGAVLDDAADRLAGAEIHRIDAERTLLSIPGSPTTMLRRAIVSTADPRVVWDVSQSPAMDAELSVSLELARVESAAARQDAADQDIVAELLAVAHLAKSADPYAATPRDHAADDAVLAAAGLLLDLAADPNPVRETVLLSITRDLSGDLHVDVAGTFGSDLHRLAEDGDALRDWLPRPAARMDVAFPDEGVRTSRLDLVVRRCGGSRTHRILDPGSADAMTLLRLHRDHAAGRLPRLSEHARRLVG